MPDNLISEEFTEIIADCPTSLLRPKAFFLSWHGVMTLAYEGFSQCILDLKTRLEKRFPKIPNENEGSKWPKTTIGALKQGRVLTKGELKRLKTLCSKHNKPLAQVQSSQFKMDSLEYVAYKCRSLERISKCSTMHLNQVSATEYKPPAFHIDQVNSVLEQFSLENISSYIEKVQKDGHREHHYRSNISGASLICWLPNRRKFIQQINKFIAEVDATIPGHYIWFKPNSRHVTIRSL